MIGGEILRVPYPHYLKQPEVRPKDIFAEQTQQLTLADIPPRLLMSEPQALNVVTEEVYQPKQSQEVGHLIIPWDMHPT